MTNYSKLYWLTRLDMIQGVFILIVTFCVIGLVIYLVGRLCSTDYIYNKKEEEKARQNFINTFKWVPKTCSWLISISILIIVFLPTKSDMILIYAGGKTIDFVQSDSSMNKLPIQTTKFISEYLDKRIEDLKKRK